MESNSLMLDVGFDDRLLNTN